MGDSSQLTLLSSLCKQPGSSKLDSSAFIISISIKDSSFIPAKSSVNGTICAQSFQKSKRSSLCAIKCIMCINVSYGYGTI